MADPGSPDLTTPMHEAHPSSLQDDFEHPEQIGPYHIIQVIGEGGMRPRKKARTRKEREMIRPMVRVTDGATVLAIFPGVAVLGGPFTVVTDFILKPEVYSEWENPFTVHPTNVTYFSE